MRGGKFRPTENIYRQAVSFLVEAYDAEWDLLKAQKAERAKFRAAELLVHRTKQNVPKYNFDAEFPKFPSYLRRAAIQAALGAVSSYRSNLKNWE